MNRIKKNFILPFNHLRFNLFLIFKWLALFLKKNKNIEKRTFDYFKCWHAENSYLIVHLKFKNAIYFKIDNHRFFDLQNPIILDLEKLETKKVQIEIFGFRQSKVYTIDIEKEIQLSTKSFNTTIKNISTFKIGQQNMDILIPRFRISKVNPRFKSHDVFVETNQIQVVFNNFKIQEFI
jgi:hypothetical protein